MITDKDQLLGIRREREHEIKFARIEKGVNLALTEVACIRIRKYERKGKENEKESLWTLKLGVCRFGKYGTLYKQSLSLI